MRSSLSSRAPIMAVAMIFVLTTACGASSVGGRASSQATSDGPAPAVEVVTSRVSVRPDQTDYLDAPTGSEARVLIANVLLNLKKNDYVAPYLADTSRLQFNSAFTPIPPTLRPRTPQSMYPPISLPA